MRKQKDPWLLVHWVSHQQSPSITPGRCPSLARVGMGKMHRGTLVREKTRTQHGHADYNSSSKNTFEI